MLLLKAVVTTPQIARTSTDPVIVKIGGFTVVLLALIVNEVVEITPSVTIGTLLASLANDADVIILFFI